jgi:hypothetical protein
MAIVRAFLVVIVSFSVAIIPATAGGLVSIKPIEMAMAGQMDGSCCPCCNAQDDFKSSTACAVKCISVFAAILPNIIPLPRMVEVASPSIADAILRGYQRSPPTHPPPV